MQTFLPYFSFTKSAQVLDYKRLGKQRVETKQILQILLKETDKKGWRNHPAVRMWAGYEVSLAYYGIAICREWIRRGYKDTLLPYFVDRYTYCVDPADLPDWLGGPIHESHQSNLVRKDPKYYRKYFPNVPNDLPYYWPTQHV